MPDVRTRVLGPARQPRTPVAQTPATADSTTTSAALHATSVLLTLVAAVIFTLTEHDGHLHAWWCTAEILLQTSLVAGATIWLRLVQPQRQQSAIILPALIMVVVLSLICEPIQRALFGHGLSFEILIMHSQCNLMLALAVCGFRMSFQRLAVLIAVFLTVFCCTISAHPLLIPLTLLFAVLCISWLVLGWWDTVDRRLLSSSRQSLSLRWGVLLLALPALLVLAGGAAGSPAVTTALQGFLPSSGGNGEYDPYSRGGVNNGDALVAGSDHIRSFAPLENAPFMDSEKPSLYDVFNDMFDEPVTRPKDLQRTMALPPEQLKHTHQKMADAKKAGRQFELVRESRKRRQRAVDDLNTPALFYVAGRLPLHLRMEVFEAFDGLAWYPLDLPAPPESADLATIDDHSWLQLPVHGSGFEVFAGVETHSLTIANLDDNTIPTPLHLEGVSIDRVDRADMYEVSPAGIVSLQRKSIPAMTPIHLASHCVDPRRVADFPSIGTASRHDATSVVPEGTDMDRIRQLAQQWTAGLPRGWQQITEISRRLRTEYQLDRSALLSPTAESAVEEFLFSRKRGPEYLFASSAAVMLRTLGYSTRMVGGFYARPERYEGRSRQTPVLKEDAHFWCEVFAGAGAWMTVEASPGYRILGPEPSLWQKITSGLLGLARGVLQYPGTLALVMAGALLAAWQRTRIIDRFLTWNWQLTASINPQRQPVLLVQLIDSRLKLAGFPRPVGTTLRRWARQRELQEVRTDLEQVADLADQFVFGSQQLPSQAGDFRRLAERLSLSRLRKKRAQDNSAGSPTGSPPENDSRAAAPVGVATTDHRHTRAGEDMASSNTQVSV